jgi:hypothetical protein
MEGSASTSALPPRKPRKVNALFATIYVPLFFLAAAVSIPWTHIQKMQQRRRERTSSSVQHRHKGKEHYNESKNTKHDEAESGPDFSCGGYRDLSRPGRWLPVINREV